MPVSSAYGPTKISDVDKLKWRIKNEWADLNHAVIERAIWRHGASVYPLAYAPEADVSSIWCKGDVCYYTFDEFLKQLYCL